MQTRPLEPPKSSGETASGLALRRRPNNGFVNFSDFASETAPYI